MMIGAPRAYWVLRVYGLNVQVLDGSFKKWVSDGRPVTNETSVNSRESPKSDHVYHFEADHSLIASYDDVSRMEDAVLDSRFPNIFQQGNIPGSTNVPFNLMLNQDSTFKSEEEVREILESVGGLEDATG